MEKLLSLLEDIRPDVNFTEEDKLIDGGILDSFDIITIVSEINDAFDVEITAAALVPQNFNSIKSMWKLISQLKK